MKNFASTAPSENPTHNWIGTEAIKTRFGNLEFRRGYPTGDSVDNLEELQAFSRAVELYLSQLPAVSAFHIRKGLADFGAGRPDQFVIWETLMDAQTLLLNGSPETVYGMSFLDLSQSGPTVIEIPPGLFGCITDMWQEALISIGPTGADRDAGGKYMVLPPEYNGITPPGYFAAKSRSYGVWLGIRGFLSEGKPDNAVASIKTIRIYSVKKKYNPPNMAFLNASGRPIDTIFPDNYRFFESLAQLIEQEPADALALQDRLFLESIGIQKGRAFRPDARRIALLDDAAQLGSAIARRNEFASVDRDRIIYGDRRWELPFERGNAAYFATRLSIPMSSRIAGSGSQSLAAMRDARGAYLDGGCNYCLNLPAKIPVRNCWSVVVYDAESRSMLRSRQKLPSVHQYTDPEVNADGSVDIYFGPEAPEGGQRNWIQTIEGKGWFAVLRLYGPLESFFDRSWKPGDIEPVMPTAMPQMQRVSIPKTNVEITAGEARDIAQDAYLFGLPLVYIATQADTLTNVSRPKGIRAPFNQFAHYRKSPDSANREIVGYNADTLYSIAHLDLTAEPIVLSVPDMGCRYWIVQILDAWNDVTAAPSARTVGRGRREYALIGPGWTGQLPQGLTGYCLSSNLDVVWARIYTAGVAEYAAAHKLQDQFRLTPLSRWRTEYDPPSNVAIKEAVNIKTPVPEQVLDMTTEAYFSRLCDLLVANPGRPVDAPVLTRMARLGLKPGSSFHPDDFDSDVQQAIEEGVRAAKMEITNGHENLGDRVNGWQIARNLGRYGTNYAHRARWTFFSVGSNLVEDALYAIATQDRDGNTLTGAGNYRLCFLEKQLPPVNAFWSITLYDTDGYFISNPIGRYSRSSRDRLKYDDDGSLIIYIQTGLPDGQCSVNWLPAPQGRFCLMLRLYWPKPPVAGVKWTPPGIERLA